MSVTAASPTPTNAAGFGVLAERFRRAGQPEKAVALCREGLAACPEHLSARVTLGWSLLDLGEYQEAFGELKAVLKRAPDNLAAIRGLAELHERGVGLDHESFTSSDDDHDLQSLFEPMDAAPTLLEPVVDEPVIVEPVIVEPAFADAVVAEPVIDVESPYFAIEDVMEEMEAVSEEMPEDLPEDSSVLVVDEPPPISLFERAPLALRDEFDEVRVDRLHAWLSRVRERRTETMAQYDMAG